MRARAPRPWDPTPEEAAITRAAVGLVAGFDRMIAQLQAQRAAAMEIVLSVALAQRERYERIPVGETRDGEAVFEPDDMPVRSAVAEVSATTRTSRRQVERELSDVWALGNRFPAVRAAFEAGRIDAGRASIVVGEGGCLTDDDLRAAYERLVLPHAEEKTSYGTREAARRIAASLEPEPFQERHERARRARGVFVHDLDDGMAELCLVGDAVVVHGAHDRLTQMARKMAAARVEAADRAAAGDGPGGAADGLAPVGDVHDDGATIGDARGDAVPVLDERTFDQLRADLAVDLLLSGAPQAHRVADPTGRNALDVVQARVHVTLPVTSLAGLDDEPADLSGYGPTAASLARRLAATAAGWARMFHHPGTGALLTVDRYAPTAEQRRYLRGRDETCRHPHCERRASGADIDHTVDYAHGGETDVSNLAHLCRLHHVLKHHSPWAPTIHPNGDVAWTSPAGYVHTTRPRAVVRFVDAAQARRARVKHAPGPASDPGPRRGDPGSQRGGSLAGGTAPLAPPTGDAGRSGTPVRRPDADGAPAGRSPGADSDGSFSQRFGLPGGAAARAALAGGASDRRSGAAGSRSERANVGRTRAQPAGFAFAPDRGPALDSSLDPAANLAMAPF